MATLEQIQLPSAQGNQIKSELIEALQQKEMIKARKHFQALLAHLPPKQERFSFYQGVTLQKFATALNRLSPNDKELLFEQRDLSITGDYLEHINVGPSLKQLATTFQAMKVSGLKADREKEGMKHFFQDLKDPKHNQKGTGWEMLNGLLTISPDHFTNPKTKQEVHDYLGDEAQLGKKDWYETPTDGPKAKSTDYGIDIKTLGKNGQNRAVDPIFILKTQTGQIKVLCGKRRGGYALPGGMNESTVIDTCISELLEECFSGKMFEKDTLTSEKLNAKKISYRDMFSSVEKIIQQALYKGKPPKKGATNYNELLQSHTTALQAASTKAKVLAGHVPTQGKSASEYIATVIADISRNMMDEGNKAPLIAHIKCELYKQFLNEEYKKFETFIKARMHIEEMVMNQSDPRNTDLAQMWTTPVEAVIDELELTHFLQKECDLEYGAGDDLANVQYRPLTRLLENITDSKKGVYSDHTTLVLNAISRGVERGEIPVDRVLLSQLETITQSNLRGGHEAITQLSEVSQHLEKTLKLTDGVVHKSLCFCS